MVFIGLEVVGVIVVSCLAFLPSGVELIPDICPY